MDSHRSHEDAEHVYQSHTVSMHPLPPLSYNSLKVMCVLYQDWQDNIIYMFPTNATNVTATHSNSVTPQAGSGHNILSSSYLLGRVCGFDFTLEETFQLQPSIRLKLIHRTSRPQGNNGPTPTPDHEALEMQYTMLHGIASPSKHWMLNARRASDRGVEMQ